jgi:hypothetical protein
MWYILSIYSHFKHWSKHWYIWGVFDDCFHLHFYYCFWGREKLWMWWKNNDLTFLSMILRSHAEDKTTHSHVGHNKIWSFKILKLWDVQHMLGPHWTFDDAPNTCECGLAKAIAKITACLFFLNEQSVQHGYSVEILLRVQTLAIICGQAKHNRLSVSNTITQQASSGQQPLHTCRMGLVGLALMYYGTSFRGSSFIGPMLTYYGTKPHRTTPYLLWNELHRADRLILRNGPSRAHF